MENSTNKTVEDRRAEDKTLEEDARGVLARLEKIPDATVVALGTETLPLRSNDDRDTMVDAVRKEAAKLTHLTTIEPPRELSPEAAEHTLSILKTRFDTNSHLHEGCDWNRVKMALEKNPEALWSVHQMEEKGHMPDVYHFDNESFYIGTCSEQTPEDARNCVYDAEAAAYLEENFPDIIFNGSAVEMAEAMGIKLMSPAQYTLLQSRGKFDTITWSFLLTDKGTRESGQALVGGRNVMGFGFFKSDTHHYGNAKAWRGSLRVSWS